MQVCLTEGSCDRFSVKEPVSVLSEDGTQMAHGNFVTLLSRYGTGYIKTLAVAGVATAPQHRRSGCVRAMFDKAFELNQERDWVVSVLHPFSFSYYKKFGYDRVADHTVLEFPMSVLSDYPRVNDFILLDDEKRIEDVNSVFDKYTLGKSLPFFRYNKCTHSLNPNKDNRFTYIRYYGTEPVAYVTVGIETIFSVNKMVSINLHVYELAYTCREALCDILGFLRMYEGQLETVKIHNASLSPELEFMLGEHHSVSCTVLPDIAARVMDTQKLLESHSYPDSHGTFTLLAEDSLPKVAGCFEVEYGGGNVSVKKLADGSAYDIKASSPALVRLLYGRAGTNANTASYIGGTEFRTPAEDFFRAFPPGINGVFEHF